MLSNKVLLDVKYLKEKTLPIKGKSKLSKIGKNYQE